MPAVVPCGQCIGCRLERSRQWAVRCMHEASLYESNCSVTLTYADEHVPPGGSLDRRAFPLFMRRLRKRGAEVRTFYCGEYGERLGRPHYHALLFNWVFPDAVGVRDAGAYLARRSPMLEELWPFGLSEIGEANFEMAAYVARYVTKKVTGARAAEHYGGKVPEFAGMSRRPGIGAAWFDRFHREVYTGDSVIANGRECRPPRYYDERLKQRDPFALQALKLERARKVKVFGSFAEESYQREADELVLKAKLGAKKRRLG